MYYAGSRKAGPASIIYHLLVPVCMLGPCVAAGQSASGGLNATTRGKQQVHHSNLCSIYLSDGSWVRVVGYRDVEADSTLHERMTCPALLYAADVGAYYGTGQCVWDAPSKTPQEVFLLGYAVVARCTLVGAQGAGIAACA